MKLSVLAATAMVAISACASIPMGLRHGAFVEGGPVSYVANRGAGPTVVFESGLGDGLGSWSRVYDSAGEFAGVFAYSRPGYSGGVWQSLPRGPRTADDAARFLKRTLEKTGTPPPYVLVGHSIGGLYVLEFVRDYPELVAGLVLVDARLPEFAGRCVAAGVKPCSPPASAAAAAPAHVRAELLGLAESERTGPEPADIGSIPAILLAATEPPPGASADGQPVWLKVQQEFADGLPNGRLEIARGSGHYIQDDAPGMVVSAIREVLVRAARNETRRISPAAALFRYIADGKSREIRPCTNSSSVSLRSSCCSSSGAAAVAAATPMFRGPAIRCRSRPSAYSETVDSRISSSG